MSGVANDSAWPWAIGAAERYGSEPFDMAKLRQAMAAMDAPDGGPAPDLRPILTRRAAHAYEAFMLALDAERKPLP